MTRDDSYWVFICSKFHSRTIGVIGVDVTLEEIENILTGYAWGSAYAFLINNDGETIFHPLLRPSTQVGEIAIMTKSLQNAHKY